MHMDRWAIAATAAVVLVGGLVVFLRSDAGRDSTRDVGVRLDLVEDGPLQLRLGGELWRDRTERGEDDAPDVAYVPRGASLTVGVAGRDGRRPAVLSVSFDGRVITQRRLCHATSCPTVARATFEPGRSASLGRHRVTVEARGGAPGQVVRTSFEVTIGTEPVVLEGELVARRSERPSRSSLGRSERRDTLAIIERERRAGTLRRVLGRTRFRVAQIGRLTTGGRPRGTTVLLDLRQVRRRVRARVPLYLPMTSVTARFRLRRVILSAPVLRDLLVDVDVMDGRVVAVQPGPRSRTDRHQQRVGPTPVDSPSDIARANPRLVRLSDRGPAFLNYDGTPTLGRAARDWPVSLLFTGNASVHKVKRALRRLGFKRRGLTAYLPYRLAGAHLRFDGDGGLKTACDRQGTDVHLRLYAPGATNRFADPDFGHVVVASAHLDHGDGCGAGPKLFGFSERAEQRIAREISARLHWVVRPNHLALGNAEPYRRDTGDSAHVWSSDGRATQMVVP